MGFLKNLRFLLILGLIVSTHSHVIRRQRNLSELKNVGEISENLRTPQKYIIKPVQQIIENNSEINEVPVYDAVDYNDGGNNEGKEKVEVDQGNIEISLKDEAPSYNAMEGKVNMEEAETELILQHSLSYQNVPEIPTEIVAENESTDVANETEQISFQDEVDTFMSDLESFPFFGKNLQDHKQFSAGSETSQDLENVKELADNEKDAELLLNKPEEETADINSQFQYDDDKDMEIKSVTDSNNNILSTNVEMISTQPEGLENNMFPASPVIATNFDPTQVLVAFVQNSKDLPERFSDTEEEMSSNFEGNNEGTLLNFELPSENDMEDANETPEFATILDSFITGLESVPAEASSWFNGITDELFDVKQSRQMAENFENIETDSENPSEINKKTDFVQKVGGPAFEITAELNADVETFADNKNIAIAVPSSENFQIIAENEAFENAPVSEDVETASEITASENLPKNVAEETNISNANEEMLPMQEENSSFELQEIFDTDMSAATEVKNISLSGASTVVIEQLGLEENASEIASNKTPAETTIFESNEETKPNENHLKLKDVFDASTVISFENKEAATASINPEPDNEASVSENINENSFDRAEEDEIISKPIEASIVIETENSLSAFNEDLMSEITTQTEDKEAMASSLSGTDTKMESENNETDSDNVAINEDSTEPSKEVDDVMSVTHDEIQTNEADEKDEKQAITNNDLVQSAPTSVSVQTSSKIDDKQPDSENKTERLSNENAQLIESDKNVVPITQKSEKVAAEENKEIIKDTADIQETFVDSIKVITETRLSKTKVSSDKDAAVHLKPLHTLVKPTKKPFTPITLAPKPIKLIVIHHIATKKPKEHVTSSAIKKHHRKPTAAPVASLNIAHIKKPNSRKPVTHSTTSPNTATIRKHHSKTSANVGKVKSTNSNILHTLQVSMPKLNNSTNNNVNTTVKPWFNNLPSLTSGYSTLFVSPINRNQSNLVNFFSIPWQWKPLNFTNLQFFTFHSNNGTTTAPKQIEAEKLGDSAFWNVLMHRNFTNTNSSIFSPLKLPTWNDTKENSHHINATTPASFNNSTLEITSSAGVRRVTRRSTEETSQQQRQRQRHQRFGATLNCINGRSSSCNVNNGEDENHDDDADDDNDENNQFIVNRQQRQQRHQQQQQQQYERHRAILCRTPPPNYHSLAAVTPPPSYTPPRQQIQIEDNLQNLNIADDVNVPYQQQQEQNQQQQQQHEHEHHQRHPLSALRRIQAPEVVGLGIDAIDAIHDVQLNGLNVIERQQQQQAQQQAQQHRGPHLIARATSPLADTEAGVVNAPNRRQVLVANGRIHHHTRNVATVSQQQHQQQKQQQRRRKQRRRKLHLLQQQQQQLQQHQYQQHLPSIIVSTSDTDSSSSLSDISQNSNEFPRGGGSTRDQRRRRRQRLLKLRDAYCPDLLNACSLILLQQQTSDSTVGSFTDTPPELVHDSSDYVEITEYHRNPQRLQYAQSTPEIREGGQHQHNGLNGIKERHHETSAERAEENQRKENFKQEMGQNLSIRRPRISLTWVLREQQQQTQQQQQQQSNDTESNAKENDNNKENAQRNHRNNSQKLTNNNQVNAKVSKSQDSSNHNSGGVEKKKYRLKQLPASAEPLNGYATTPTSYTNASTALGSQKFFSNQNLLEYHKDDAGAKPPSKDLLFVCTPQRVPDGFGGSSEALALAKKRNEIRKKLAAKMAQFRAENQATRLVTNISSHLNGGVVSLKRDTKSSLKSGSYSEPSLIAASEGNSRRHRHRKRRERNRPPKFGYDIKNVDEFLTKCSLATPANIPMVLSTSCILYQTRPGGYQTEISLPLGMVVNAVFKNQNWLYVQTPHAEEGYVNYTTCLPLGILPPEARKEGKTEAAKTKPCWESNGDVFPKPCGNMTDSEKEIHLRVGTRSEGARTPHLKNQLTDNETATVISAQTDNTDCINGNTSSIYGEQQVDKLYLRAASQPKLTAEKTSYAQLKIIRNHSSAASATSSKSHANNDEYVTLQQKGMQKHVHHMPAQKTYISRTFITNGHNGQHLHPKDMKNLQVAANNCNNLKNPTVQQLNNSTTTITVTSYPATLQQQHQHSSIQRSNNHHHHHNNHQQTTTLATSTSLHHINNQSLTAAAVSATTTATTSSSMTVAPRSILNAIRRSSAHCGQRQTLVAITTDYSTGDGLTLQKGDIVTLCECRETKDHRQWFYVRTRDGRQGYIPAEVAGHGYL